MRHLHLRACFVVALAAAALPAPAQAGLLELVSSGTEATGATVGTTTLTSNTAFTATAIFDTTTGRPASGAVAYTITSLTINVTGIGTFTVAPSNFTGATPQVTVFLEDPSTIGSFGAGFENAVDTNGYVANYGSSSNATFSAASPSPTIFANFLHSSAASYLVTLANGAGSFSLGDITSDPITSSIITPSTAVPEPSSLALLGAGVAVMALAARRRRVPRVRSSEPVR